MADDEADDTIFFDADCTMIKEATSEKDEEVAGESKSSLIEGIKIDDEKKEKNPDDVEHEWEMLNDEHGNIYYYNEKNGISQWEVPKNGVVKCTQLNNALSEGTPTSTNSNNQVDMDFNPPGDQYEWQAQSDLHGNVFFVSTITGETRWDNPYWYDPVVPNPAPDQLKQNHLSQSTYDDNGEYISSALKAQYVRLNKRYKIERAKLIKKFELNKSKSIELAVTEARIKFNEEKQIEIREAVSAAVAKAVQESEKAYQKKLELTVAETTLKLSSENQNSVDQSVKNVVELCRAEHELDKIRALEDLTIEITARCRAEQNIVVARAVDAAKRELIIKLKERASNSNVNSSNNSNLFRTAANSPLGSNSCTPIHSIRNLSLAKLQQSGVGNAVLTTPVYSNDISSPFSVLSAGPMPDGHSPGASDVIIDTTANTNTNTNNDNNTITTHKTTIKSGVSKLTELFERNNSRSKTM